MEKWKIIKSNYIYRHKYLTVRKDEVDIPNGGHIDDFFVIENADWVNVIAITEDNLFVMERQYRHGIQEIGIEICAGMIDRGEKPLEAAQRELLEETGYEGGEWIEYSISTPDPSSMAIRNYTFLAKGVKKVQNQNFEQTEKIDVFLSTPQEVLKYLKANKISEGVMQAPLWRFMYENNI